MFFKNSLRSSNIVISILADAYCDQLFFFHQRGKRFNLIEGNKAKHTTFEKKERKFRSCQRVPLHFMSEILPTLSHRSMIFGLASSCKQRFGRRIWINPLLVALVFGRISFTLETRAFLYAVFAKFEMRWWKSCIVKIEKRSTCTQTKRTPLSLCCIPENIQTTWIIFFSINST